LGFPVIVHGAGMGIFRKPHVSEGMKEWWRGNRSIINFLDIHYLLKAWGAGTQQMLG